MIRFLSVTALLVASTALAQPSQPTPTQSTPVRKILAAAPYIVITNGMISAKITPPDLAHGFYRGTRFDQAGVITSLRFHGREYYGPWFDRVAPQVLDYAYDASGAVVAGPDSAISGPVEEFAPLDFVPRPGLFVKIGVGVLRQPDQKAYDHYRHYQIIDAGKRSTQTTANQVTFIQSLHSDHVSYVYEKTLRLVPGKPELVIEHRLRNTGPQAIDTTVYDHNFLRLVPGDNGIRITFPFPIRAPQPPAGDLIAIRANTITYRRAMARKERVSFTLTGFGTSPSDYDFEVADMHSGAAVRIRGDQPLTKINIFSIDKVQAVEPTIAISLAPGKETHWRYVYRFRSR